MATARFSPQAMLYVNHAPSFVKGPDQVVTEDAGLQSISNWALNISAGSSQESTQQLNFIVTVDHPELFTLPPAISPAGTLTYQSVPNVSGLALVTVVLHDDGGTANGGQDTSAPQAFFITVLAVNDAPTFVVGADQMVLEDSGPQSVAGWATLPCASPKGATAACTPLACGWQARGN